MPTTPRPGEWTITRVCGFTLIELLVVAAIIITSEAVEKGLAKPVSPRAPVGFCPNCGKPSLYRAEEDPQTGEPFLPEHARFDGRNPTPKRPAR